MISNERARYRLARRQAREHLFSVAESASRRVLGMGSVALSGKLNASGSLWK
jgi:hypothetical protein